jgi:hypothetical protein
MESVRPGQQALQVQLELLEPQLASLPLVPLAPPALQAQVLASLPLVLASWPLVFQPSGTQREALQLPEVRL